ncbi:hypothetical protein [Prescottella equi]|uniref:hypothetical protein n=1 Tax=Rhodococcus hoagii TaxID=43767 RepID=UPI00111C2ED7|nr:hypothetical protein [Prescottella equi]
MSANVIERNAPPPGDLPAPTVERVGRKVGRRVGAAATRHHPLAMRWRLLSSVALAGLLFFPVFRFNLYDAMAGSPTAYLLLLPLWIGMISYGTARRSPGTVIDDSELNWIVTVGLVGLSVICVGFVVPELTVKAPIWHVELVPIFCILGAFGAVNFGVRRVARAWPAAAFVLLCFPVTVVLLAAALGGTAAAYGAVAVSLGCVALAMALHGSGIGPPLVGAAFVSGVLAVWLLRDAPPLVPMLAPAAVAPSVAFVVALATRRSVLPVGRQNLPTWSMLSIAWVLVSALLLLLVLPPAPQLARARDLSVVRADWVEHFAAAEGISIRQERTFDFAPRYLGDRSSLVRYRVEYADTTAFVDVFTSGRLGALSNFRGMSWYPGTADTRIDGGSARLGPSVNATVSYNDASAAKTPHDPVWVSVSWKWRVGGDGGDKYQQVRMLVSQRSDVPEQVPTPAAPSVSTLLLEPLGATMRRATDTPSPPAVAVERATSAARVLVGAVGDPGSGR